MPVQLREFAERVLFSTTLEEKLSPPPAGITDSHPGPAIPAPPAPGRPDSLVLRPDGVRASIPGTHELHDDAHRGQLLHFFANHELLATELMALVLLRFPDAPPEFRRGILDTLKEEQMHTKLYLKRMAECGTAFGDLPVNAFFWNCVSDMPSPLDYVTRLSLTFEQANLDYSRHFASVFEKSGDGATASILGRIYRDEIGHVGYGLHWFRKWKNPGRSDWETFRDSLSLPLSAARAKGAGPFNSTGRSEAGLDRDFISHLRVYSQSRGRTPNVYYFNPDAEAFALDARHQPEALTLDLQHDLALLPAFLAGGDDVVVVPHPPSTSFLTSLQSNGLPVPEFVPLADVPSLAERKLNELRPWAWTPDARGTLAPLSPSHGDPQFDLQLFSKTTTLDLPHSPFSALLSATPPSQLTSPGEIPPHRPLVLKAPYSTAGRNRHVIDAPSLTREQRVWFERTARNHGCVLAEPWHSRVFDFSIHFDFSASSKLRRRGFVHLDNTPRGQFRSCTVRPRFTDGMPTELRRFLHAASPNKRRSWLDIYLEETLQPALVERLAPTGYHGPVGIDSFFYRTADGSLKLRPVSEINPRYTMGRVALELSRHTPQNTATTLSIQPLTKPLPPGAIPLTDPHAARRYIATLTTKN